MVIGGLVEGLDLVAGEHESLDGPLLVVGGVDLDRDRSDDAKVVAGTLDGPPEVRVGVDGLEGAIGQHDVHRDKLVGNEAVVSLKPAVATPESRAEVADAFASSRHRLLVGGPEGVGDDLGVGASEDLGTVAAGEDRDAAQLLNGNVDAAVHATQRGDGAVDAIEDEEGDVVLVGPFDLGRWLRCQYCIVIYRQYHMKDGVGGGGPPTVWTTSFSVAGVTVTLTWGFSSWDQRCDRSANSADPGR